MLELLAKRIIRALGTLILLSIVVFSATQILPGDAAQAILGRDATPERLEILRDRLNLNDPPPVQYQKWVTSLLSGDLGVSLASGKPVAEVLGSRISNSLILLTFASIVAIPLGIALGILSAVWRGRLLDHAVSTATLTLVALPVFVLGMILIFVFATVIFRLFPPTSLLLPGDTGWARVGIYVLPIATLVLATSPYIGRMLRASMLEVLDSEYIQMAWLKGLQDPTVYLRHALPNAIVPTIQVVALNIAWMAGGIVVVEYVFRYPGVGQALIDAVALRDVPLVQALSLFIALVYIFMNLLADISAILLTPKLRA